ncbi:MAG: ABC transporter substrate-binding protein [bacterium]
MNDSFNGRVFVLLVVLLMTGGVLTSCSTGSPDSNQSSQSRTLTLSSIAPPKSFNPVTAKETSTTQITNLMFSTLTEVDGVTGEVEPGLAVEWKSRKGGRVWEFTLREGLRWSDGEPLTAQDVVFTFDRLHLNPEVNSSARHSLQVEGSSPRVESLSETRVRFTYPDPYAPFPRAANMVQIMPEHVLKQYVEDGTFNSVWGVDTDPDSFVVNGPFELSEYQTAQRVVLTRNKRFYKKDENGDRLPRLDKIRFEVVKNRDIAMQKFIKGDLDILSVQAKNLPNIEPKESKGAFTIHKVGPSLGTTLLSFNMNTDTNPETGKTYIPEYKLSWFNDSAFRRAVSYGIARQEIINIVMNGQGSPLYGPVSPANKPFFNENIKKYPHDPERARQILEENGYVDRNGDGVREGPDGNRLKFVLNTNSGNDQRVEMTEIIRQDLDNLGMDVSFSQLEFNTLTTKLNSTYDWEAIVIGFTGSLDPHFGSNLWLSSGDLHLWHPRQSEPHRKWEARIDKIFTQAVKETNRDRRRTLYNRWQRIVSENQPVVFTVKPELIYAVRDRLKNVNPTPIGGYSHNIEKIGVKD